MTSRMRETGIEPAIEDAGVGLSPNLVLLSSECNGLPPLCASRQVSGELRPQRPPSSPKSPGCRSCSWPGTLATSPTSSCSSSQRWTRARTRALVGTPLRRLCRRRRAWTLSSRRTEIDFRKGPICARTLHEPASTRHRSIRRSILMATHDRTTYLRLRLSICQGKDRSSTGQAPQCTRERGRWVIQSYMTRDPAFQKRAAMSRMFARSPIKGRTQRSTPLIEE
jgi:hypothetical protein